MVAFLLVRCLHCCWWNRGRVDVVKQINVFIRVIPSPCNSAAMGSWIGLWLLFNKKKKSWLYSDRQFTLGRAQKEWVSYHGLFFQLILHLQTLHFFEHIFVWLCITGGLVSATSAQINSLSSESSLPLRMYPENCTVTQTRTNWNNGYRSAFIVPIITLDHFLTCLILKPEPKLSQPSSSEGSSLQGHT